MPPWVTQPPTQATLSPNESPGTRNEAPDEIDYSDLDSGSSATAELEREEFLEQATQRRRQEVRRRAARRAAQQRESERPPDLIDAIQEHVGTIDPKLIKEADPNWEPQGAAKQIFKTGGRPADTAIDPLAAAGPFQIQPGLPLEQFGHLINQAAQARKEQRKSQSAEEQAYEQEAIAEAERQMEESFREDAVNRAREQGVIIQLENPDGSRENKIYEGTQAVRQVERLHRIRDRLRQLKDCLEN